MKPETIDRIRKFIADRNWEQYHTPANIAKSIAIEAGELLECYQWSDNADWSMSEKSWLTSLFIVRTCLIVSDWTQTRL